MSWPRNSAWAALIVLLGASAVLGLAQVAGRLAADETMHWTALASAIGEMLPQKALTFGA